MDELVFRFLIQSNITSISKEDIYLQLLSHSDYPSIKAITDSLDYFGIENIAANVPKDALSQLPKTFLGLLEREKRTELFLVTQTKNKILLRTIDNKKEILSVDVFSSQWTGTIIAIEKEEKKVYNVGKRSLIMPFIVVIGLLLSVLIVGMHTTSIIQVFYAVLTVIGSIISYLIAKESLGIEDTIGAKFCGVLSSKVNSCTNVITSKEGKIGESITFADGSIIYFGSLFFITTFLGVHSSVLFAISGITLLAVVYSLYLQGIKLKQWCALCLLISVVLISQFGTLLVEFSSWDFSFSYALKVIFINLLVAMAWLEGKKLLLKNKDLIETKKEYLTFKRNETFFSQALQNNVINDLDHPPSEAQIYFGHKDAPVQITAYTNPLCGYCVEAFELYDKLLNQYPDDIGIQMIFNTPDDSENPSTQIAKRILEEYHKTAKEGFEALKFWFANRDVDQWIKKYGHANSVLLMNDRILEMHRAIANRNNILYTPETLIGNNKFPRGQYEYDDLIFFIDVLKEETKKNIELEMEDIVIK